MSQLDDRDDGGSGDDRALDDLARGLPDGDPGTESGLRRREVLFAISRSRRRRVLAYRAGTVAAFALAGVVAAVVLVGLPERSSEVVVPLAETGGVTRITQDGGSVTYDVAPRRPGERFVVATPAAEIEVRGTRFTVGVQGLETAVEVEHGRVEVREPGGALRAILTKGQRTAVRRAPVAIAAPVVPPTIAAPDAPPTIAAPLPSGVGAPPRARVHSPQSATPALPAPAAVQPDDAELRLFRAAHELHFRQGDLEAAAQAWNRYLAAYPRGALREEARYNRAVCLLRLGRSADAEHDLETLAADPNAFRAREAKLLRAASLRRQGRCAEAERILGPLRQGGDEIARRATELGPCAEHD
jgi:TolA-binding protein